VRRALELATGEGIALYRDILTAFSKLPELDGQAAHKLAERIGGFGADTERLELFLSLLLGLMERLIRKATNGEGAIGEEGKLTRLLDRATVPQWIDAWEAIGQAKADAASLNLDRSLLVLETFYRLQQAARGRAA
jgi:DNA polymerase III subunit delta'